MSVRWTRAALQLRSMFFDRWTFLGRSRTMWMGMDEGSVSLSAGSYCCRSLIEDALLQFVVTRLRDLAIVSKLSFGTVSVDTADAFSEAT
ncbi:hypothetical protein MPTK1_7g16840 [Marchantia polymorpha subsp. ruderalis]|uniref:Uncharacterized protein n=2 Tax=Marchantia polymorpha TaxID=3197 RepID=A0AAF6C0H9_MARPO|nr:hypothetical protein MARPO_0051s0022 [Marchantia polymorpha]BBN17763.1 hypothetical protein Mp_7g16840 [Marchantia polymorpha subsp. ruderalis]|eukprot:PTQ38389.1 hypothetical protein MARPO_0051s0022 [Marchantia polymorpha]